MKIPKIPQPNWLALGAIIVALLMSTGIVLWVVPVLSNNALWSTIGWTFLWIALGTLVIWLIGKATRSNDPRYKRYGNQALKWGLALLGLALVIFYIIPKIAGVWTVRQQELSAARISAPQVTTRYVTATREGRRVRLTPEGAVPHAFLIASIPDESYRLNYTTAHGERGTAKCLKEQMCNLPGNIAEVVLFPLNRDSLRFEVTTYPK